MKYLNLGCGLRFHPDWTNIDSDSSSPYVQDYDLQKGIPFQDNFFDVVYHSHLLEHFPKHKATDFMIECFRVLKPGGTIRIVVPDLEQIAKLYLKTLMLALKGKKGWLDNYNWVLLELYDQAVREHPGGEMLEYFKQDPIPNESFVIKRIGDEAKNVINLLKQKPDQKIHNLKFSLINTLHNYSKKIRDHMIKLFLGRTDYIALQIGRFRSKGEIHRWMYDRYSLSLILTQSGFSDPIVRTAWDSNIENWSIYHLDTNPDGTIYKPDSIYIEAIKPNI